MRKHIALFLVYSLIPLSGHGDSQTKAHEAIAHLLNQKHEEAFESFLAALEVAQPIGGYVATSEELPIYREALAMYLKSRHASFDFGSEQMITAFQPLILKHPEYCQLAYLVAIAYANQGDFLNLFKLFYQTYLRLPDHYLASKTKAILWIKIFERALPGPQKEKARMQIINNLSEAALLYPFDCSLYRLKILYSSHSQEKEAIAESLNKIINEDIVIPRAELDFFLQKGLTLEDRPLIKNFIDKASSWYRFSRTIESAKKQLK